MLHVICLRWGTAFGPEYVYRLKAGVERNLTRPHKFTCYTDQPLEGVDCEGIDPDLETWWWKVKMFKPGVLPLGERILFLDLDTIIVGNIDPLADYDGSLACLRDVWRPWGLGCGVLAWRAGDHANIWDEWEEHGCPRMHGGDQAMIECAVPGAARFQDLFPGLVVSFKAEAWNRVPEGAGLVFFHGKPRPHEVLTGWVPEVWR